MARYPGAIWEPITGGTDGPMSGYLGVVLHVNDSDGPDLFNWEQNGAHDMSSHFQIPKSGKPFQYLDTKFDSWCQAGGNGSYISVETQGFPGEPLTRSQVDEFAKLYAWLHQVHGIPFALAEKPGDRGFGWHGMGGAAWGGHTECPGVLRKAQRSTILALAQPQGDWFDMATEADLELAVENKLKQWLPWYLARAVALARTGQPNAAFTAANSGAIVDSVGIDGKVAAAEALLYYGDSKESAEGLKPQTHPANQSGIYSLLQEINRTLINNGGSPADSHALVEALGNALLKGNS